MRTLVFSHYCEGLYVMRIDNKDENLFDYLKELFKIGYKHHDLTLDVEGEIKFIEESSVVEMASFLDDLEFNDLEDYVEEHPEMKDEIMGKLQYIRKALSIY